MKKSSKVVSLVLAVLMAVSCLAGLSFASVSASAATTIYFQIPDSTQPALAGWKTTNTAYCHIYHVYGTDKDFPEKAWGSKSEKCTYKKGDATASYDIDTKLKASLEEGNDYGVLFATKDAETGAEHQTGNVTMTSECYGGTIYVTGNLTENTEDSSKMDYEARWKEPELNAKYGPKLGITSTGKVINDYPPYYQPKAEIIAQFISAWGLKNQSIITKDVVADVISNPAFGGVTAQEVYDAYVSLYPVPDTEKQLTHEQVYELLGLNDQPKTTEPEPTTTEPVPTTTEPEPTTTEPISEDVYVVAGVEALTGYEWEGDPAKAVNAVMTKNADGTYTKTFADVQPAEALQFKIVKNGTDWMGDATGNNYTFNVVSACDVTITFDPATSLATYAGEGIKEIEFSLDSLYAVGNGDGAWLNDAAWDPAAEVNKMTADGSVYTITMEKVPADDNYQIKFAANGSWADSWGIADSDADGTGDVYTPGTTIDAAYNGSNIVLPVGNGDEDTNTYTVTCTVDLTAFDYASKTGGTIKIDVTPEEIGTTEPEPTTTEPVPTTTEPITQFAEQVYGDVNMDNDITIDDATLIQQAAINLVEFNELQNAVADVNADGDVNIIDVTYLQKYLAVFNYDTKLVGKPYNTQPATTEPATTEPVTTEEPTTTPVPAGDTYIVAGTDNVFGLAWDGTAEVNKMTYVDGVYVLTLEDVDAVVGQCKVVKNGTEWFGDSTGNNITFSVNTPGTVTITYVPSTGEILVDGDDVTIITTIDIQKIEVVGNGDGTWLNDAVWKPDSGVNVMEEISDNVYQIVYTGVEGNNNDQFKFAVNGSWNDNWGGVFAGYDVPTEAVYNSADNITLVVGNGDDDTNTYTITITLDLTKFDYTTKTGATFTVSQVAE